MQVNLILGVTISPSSKNLLKTKGFFQAVMPGKSMESCALPPRRMSITACPLLPSNNKTERPPSLVLAIAEGFVSVPFVKSAHEPMDKLTKLIVLFCLYG